MYSSPSRTRAFFHKLVEFCKNSNLTNCRGPWDIARVRCNLTSGSHWGVLLKVVLVDYLLEFCSQAKADVEPEMGAADFSGEANSGANLDTQLIATAIRSPSRHCCTALPFPH